MVDLQIQQQFGRIGLQVTPFQYNVSITPANFEVQQRPAEISLEQPAATIEIDNTPARESLGYYGVVAEQRAFDQEAKSTTDAGISRRVREGEQFADLTKKVSVARIVSQDAEPRQKEVQIGCSQPIRISVTTYSVNYQANIGGVSVDARVGSVHGDLQYGSAQSIMEQNPYIKFHAVGAIYDVQK
ncbi:DUF6470 family protein [Desulfosporosinus sp. FKA]|uniref:DUF6470 family protein n=1 Tax=Desulfosporosinus sp. FKA TaxID=1969834 RepID=UPI000B49D64F|nr:DUF6470 family protein [Desulfosporosinus sp. FKA]